MPPSYPDYLVLVGCSYRRASIPLLADLPLLGKLFEWRSVDSKRTEMNIFLIPRIVPGGEGVVTQDFFIQTQ